MKTGFSEPAARFHSASQAARVVTEEWAGQNMFCPNCGNSKLSSFPANRPVADLFCERCEDEFELKSQSRQFGRKVADGAFATKMERLAANNSPNLILLQYDRHERRVRNLKVVPRFFFTPSIVEQRKPLGPHARRAGWVGSNILLDRIPAVGQISIIDNGLVRNRSEILKEWNDLRFIARRVGEARGWLLEVMSCVERIGKYEFSISDIYEYEQQLQRMYPMNNNVRPKIRQQLQILRDNGILEFMGSGRYRLRST